MQLLLQEFVCGIDITGWGLCKGFLCMLWCDGSCATVTGPVQCDAVFQQ
jgi:hypothetical protein